MFGLVGRRFYATRPPPLPTRLTARTSSTPLQVRIRREKKYGPAKRTDASQYGLSPSEQARYDRLKALEKLPTVDGEPLSEKEWLRTLNRRRSRIRGIRTVKRDGKQETVVVGQPVYLPNIVFTLVRNHTLPGEPYNPYEATFYLPLSVTKTDVRSYLKAMYGVDTTYIRTDIARGHKRAVVGLVDPFYYPHRLEDMGEKEREEYVSYLNDTYQITQHSEIERMRNYSRNLVMMGKSIKDASRAAEKKKWKEPRKGRVRENAIMQQANEWRKKRERGEEIVIKRPTATDTPPPQ